MRREQVEHAAGEVAAAFAAAGLTEPHFLEAVPSRPAGRVVTDTPG
ncbi:hypothetical protein [Ornithinimicrobium sp. W1665]